MASEIMQGSVIEIRFHNPLKSEDERVVVKADEYGKELLKAKNDGWVFLGSRLLSE